MRQALHILTKDVRRLWYEILVVLGLEAAFAWMASDRGQGQLMTLFLVPWWYLIVRVVHFEPVPGDRQFWLTRPYAWKSLLGAKALFIVAFVSVPMLMADCAIVTAQRFALGSCVYALLWKQVMWTVMFVLPTAAVAAVTRKLGEAILVSALLLMAGFAGSVVAFLSGAGDLGSLEWIRESVVMLALLAAAIVILFWQYSRRKTDASRLAMFCAVAVAVSTPIIVPWGLAFAIQSGFSRVRIDDHSVRVAFDPPRNLHSRYNGKPEIIQLDLPIQVAAIPAGMVVKSDRLVVRIEAPGGAAWRSPGNGDPMYIHDDDGGYWANIALDRRFFDQVKDQQVRLRITLYLTLFGNRKSYRIPSSDVPQAVPGLGLCSIQCIGKPGNWQERYLCRSVFRRPFGLVSLRPDSYNGSAIQLSRAYSPLPVDPGISPILMVANGGSSMSYLGNPSPLKTPDATILTIEEPLAHIQRDFEIPSVRLADYEARLPLIPR